LLIDVVDAVPGRPSKANHLPRYFRVLFGWGMRHGQCKTNPAEGAKQVKERKRHGTPSGWLVGVAVDQAELLHAGQSPYAVRLTIVSAA
jgi:hypothetical protein